MLKIGKDKILLLKKIVDIVENIFWGVTQNIGVICIIVLKFRVLQCNACNFDIYNSVKWRLLLLEDNEKAVAQKG